MTGNKSLDLRVTGVALDICTTGGKISQVQFEATYENEPAVGKSLEEMRKSRIKGKKSKISECKNNLQKAKETWTELFPIEEDLYYQKAVAKINRLELELQSI